MTEIKMKQSTSGCNCTIER